MFWKYILVVIKEHYKLPQCHQIVYLGIVEMVDFMCIFPIKKKFKGTEKLVEMTYRISCRMYS